MALYDVVNGVYRKVSKKYDSVNGVYRKVKAAYDSVEGVYRKYFGSDKTISAGTYWARDLFWPPDFEGKQSLAFKSYGTNYVAMGMDWGDRMFRYYLRNGNYDDAFDCDERSDGYGYWTDGAFSTIEITSDQVVPEEFYNWFRENWYKVW